jgi:hypothetical protein
MEPASIVKDIWGLPQGQQPAANEHHQASKSLSAPSVKAAGVARQASTGLADSTQHGVLQHVHVCPTLLHKSDGQWGLHKQHTCS